MAALWVGLLAILYLLALRSLRPEHWVLRSRPMVWFGDVSYALYLVHAPVLMVVYGLGAKVLGVSSNVGLMALGGFAAVLSVLVAALGHALIERPAQRLVLRLAGQARAPVTPAVARAE